MLGRILIGMRSLVPTLAPTEPRPHAAHIHLVPDEPPTPAAWSPQAVIERLRSRIRTRRLSPRTEETYLRWSRRYLDFHGRRHPAALGRVELRRFVTHLVEREGLSAQSVNQAASSVAFMYRELYGQELGGRDGARGKEPDVLPKYATPEEIGRVLVRLRGLPLIASMLMYGSGTRIAETLAVRVKDVSLENRELHVRSGKGARDRTTVVASAAIPVLRDQIRLVAELHANDVAAGGGWAPLPGALHRKDPHAGWDLGWQYVFPSTKTSVDEKTGRSGRRHLHATVVQCAVKRAARAARVPRPVTCHVLRHCFATELLRNGCDIKLLQRLMGHRDLRTTSRYLHILDRPGVAVVSPLDRLPSVAEDAAP
jgi:integron integrase